MNKTLMLALLLAGSTALGAPPPTPVSPFHAGWIDYNKNGRKDVFEDSSQPVEKRLDDLWRRMTFAEKLAQIRTHHGGRSIDPQHLPVVGTIVDAERGMNLKQACTQLATWQRHQIEDTRLGIPFLYIEEALHGLLAKQATSFPQATALASTWNLALMSRVANAIAVETRARGIRQVLSPVVDVGRDSRWGRTEETYGEDPYLVSRMAVAFCRAFTAHGIITTPKHFVADWGDGGRDSWAQFLDERTLDEIYFPPYKACIQEGGSLSIMPSYGSLNGLPNVSSPWLLTEMARKDWGFRGYFGSDFGAVDGVRSHHDLTTDDAEVAALCLNAGMDVEWPESRYYAKPLDEALARGLVSRRTVEASARRVLRVKFEIGLFDHPFPDTFRAAEKVTNTAAHRQLALEAARQALVLLKNQGGLLPLDPSRLKVVAVIGRDAKVAQLGDYSGSDIRTVSLLDGLRSHLPGVDIRYSPGVTDLVTPFMSIQGATVNDGAGWRYRIWDNTAGSGNPVATGRSDVAGRFDRRPMVGRRLGRHGSRVQWSGNFKPEHDMAAHLEIQGSDRLTLTVNGREVLNNRGTAGKPDVYVNPALGPLPGTVDEGRPHYQTDFSFHAGRTYELTLTRISDDGGSPAMLAWDQRPALSGEIARAVDVARHADAVIVVPGGIVEGEGHDRVKLGYPPGDVRLIKALAALHKPLVAVLINGAAVTITNWQRRVPAILEAWYDGEEQGNAIADALLGKYNPGGRLPLTFPRYAGQMPLNYDYDAIGRGGGYHDPWKGRPMYPFGYGLSYTTFAYSHLHVSPDRVHPGDSVTVSFDVTNTGDRAGDEVAQLYLHDVTASVVRPVEQLKGFERLTLAPGQTKTVKLTLTPADLSLWNRDLKFVMEPRPITILVGSSSAAIHLEGHLDIVR